MDLLLLLFAISLLLNGRGAFKLLLDWKGMRTTVGFVKEAYAAVDRLPEETALEEDDRTPIFLHLV
ncbi:MAG: hypothetical protein HY215_04210, partial [Candidatus Rokubacteria bacterium]|nr:hypothetical protein [Candidatus Rokubacteria bacterium]